MESNEDLTRKWALEYSRGGIPSSVRETPSGAVEWAVGELKRQGYPLKNALDAGCGKGRNSLFLAAQGAHVTSLDFTPDAIHALRASAAVHGFADKIRPIVQDLTEPWPVAEASQDLIIDAFAFKHITKKQARDSYRTQLLRALRVRGHYMISFASIGDGYYGQYVIEHLADGEELLIADPANGIESVLYSRDRVLQYFAPELVPFEELHNAKPSVMHGTEYVRSTYALLLRRNPHSF